MALIGWGARRKFLYTAVAAFFLLILALITYKILFTRTPNCFDGFQNGIETGVDCGGNCALVCTEQSRAPVVLWARSFLNSPKNYTVAAYVQNNNPGAGARQVSYSFQLLDSKNELVVERTGVMDLPPVVTIPIVETNVDVGNREVARTLFAFSEVPVWNKVSATRFPQIRVSGQSLNNDGSRLSVNVHNDGTASSGRLVVTAVLFDSTNTARAASKSIIDNIAKKSSEGLVFTWPGGVANIVRAEITVLPSF